MIYGRNKKKEREKKNEEKISKHFALRSVGRYYADGMPEQSGDLVGQWKRRGGLGGHK